MKSLLLPFCVTILLYTGQSFATTVIPFTNPAEAVQLCETVVKAKALVLYETAENGTIYYDCLFLVENSVKGSLSVDETFVVRQYSKKNGDLKMTVAGDFIPEQGEHYLLFLGKTGQVWRPVTLSFYVFREVWKNNESCLTSIQQGMDISMATRPDGLTPEPIGVYKTEALLAALTHFATHKNVVWNSAEVLSEWSPHDFIEDRALPTGCDFNLGGGLTRWQNAAINIYYDVTNAPGNALTLLVNSITTLNSQYTGIDPIASGSTDFAHSCGDGSVLGIDFINYCDNSLNDEQSSIVFFEDPCSEIADLNMCVGTLAFGGSYSYSSTHTYKGDVWFDAAYAFVVTNNGSHSCLSSANFEILLQHEMTHGYSMDHLNSGTYPNQNMNPLCCNAINTKDRECMNYTYDIALPVELISFQAAYIHESGKISWATASEYRNDYFILERSADGTVFSELAKVPSKGAGAYAITDIHPIPGHNYYRLSQADLDGHITYLGIRHIMAAEMENSIQVLPNPVKNQEIQIISHITESFDGLLEIVDQKGTMVYRSVVQLEAGKGKISIQAKLPSGVYYVRMQNEKRVLQTKLVRS